VSSLQSTRFPSARGGKETRQRANAPQCVHPLRAPVAQILPSRSDALVVLPVTQADRQPQKRSASREIVPVQRRRAILSCCQKSIRKQRGTMVGTSDARRKRWKIRPAGTISREVMRGDARARGLLECTIRIIKRVRDPNYLSERDALLLRSQWANTSMGDTGGKRALLLDAAMLFSPRLYTNGRFLLPLSSCSCCFGQLRFDRE
jgi:hypothetical protein